MSASILCICALIPQDTAWSGPCVLLGCAQLIDSAGSADSNYRACCKGRSRKEFISKIGIAAEEADESLGWLLALRDAGLGDKTEVRELLREANELTAIFVASGKTAKDRLASAEAEDRLARRRRAKG